MVVLYIIIQLGVFIKEEILKINWNKILNLLKRLGTAIKMDLIRLQKYFPI